MTPIHDSSRSTSTVGFSLASPASRGGTSSAPAASLRKERVLVVDDEKDLVELISFNLARNGYDVVAAGTGNDALEVATASSPTSSSSISCSRNLGSGCRTTPQG